MTRAPEGDRSDREDERIRGDTPTGHPGTAARRGDAAGAEAAGAGKERKPSRYLAGRMYGAAMLDGAVFRAVRDDRFATFQALQVVLLAGLSAAMSGTLPGEDPRISLGGAVIAWLAWVFFAHLTSTRALGLADEDPDWNRLLRTAGMSLSPAIFLLFSRIPVAGLFFFSLGVAWTAVAMTGAVRHTYDGGTWAKAIQASVVGWLAAVIVYAAIVLINAQVRGT